MKRRDAVTRCALLSLCASAVAAFAFQSIDSSLHRQPRRRSMAHFVLQRPLDGDVLGSEFLNNDDVDIDSDNSLLGFYDLDDDSTSLNTASSTSLFDGFTREEAEILDERESRLYEHSKTIEKCILVGVENLSVKRKSRSRQRALDESQNDGCNTADNVLEEELYFTLDESLTEMRELIKTAGLQIAGEVTQRLNEVNPKFYINTGKVEEAKTLLQELGCKTIIFDAELSPGQQKSLENAFNKKLIQNDFLVSEQEIKVIDRTALILDIFAQHAKTKEGKLQVELALHEYRKPRLTKMWTHLERQSGAGGVGLRGPGELQLEIDKRIIRERINNLRSKIDAISRQRTMRRRGRERMGLPIISLVGYTNSGKSSTLNFLTRAGVMAEAMLFATLDPTTRKVKLPGYRTHPEILLTDTVGFIQKLPTHLVAAFRATLEEVSESDVLIHVIDVSSPSWEKQEASVLSVLADIGCKGKPIVRVLNKIDLLDEAEADLLRYNAAAIEHTVAVSALTGDGMSDMVACVEDALAELLVSIEVEIPYSKGDEMNILHEQGNVEFVDYREQGTYVRALVPQAVANRLKDYSVVTEERIQDANMKNDGIDWVALGRGRHPTPEND